MVRHPDFGRHSRRDGRREFTYAAIMSGKVDRRLHRRAALRCTCIALRLALAVALSLSPGLASAADTEGEPSLASRLGAMAGSVYDTAESHIIAPARQSAEALLADPRTEEIYQHLSATAQDVVGLADTHVLQPISRESADLIGRWDLRRSYEKVMAIAGDLAERLRLSVLDPFIAGLKRVGERAAAPSPTPAATAPRLASLDPRAAALAIPGLPQSDLSGYLNGDDPIEPFNRLMFQLNGGLQAKVLGPVSELYRDHISAVIRGETDGANSPTLRLCRAKLIVGCIVAQRCVTRASRLAWPSHSRSRCRPASPRRRVPKGNRASPAASAQWLDRFTT